MTDRLTVDTITDPQLDKLYARLEEARRLLTDFTNIADVTHKYRIMGGCDSLGANHSCAGCELNVQVRAYLEAAR